jgi:hypothetical protein
VFLCVLGSEGCVLVPRSSGQWHSGYVGLANLGSESETCVGSRVHLVGVSISFEKNFYRLTFTPPSLVRRIGPSVMDETSIFFLSTQTETEEGSHRGGLTVVRPSRARRRPGVGGTETGGRGQLIPVLTSGWDGLWREIDDGGWTVGRGVTGGGGGSSGERGGSGWEVWGEAESGAGYLWARQGERVVVGGWHRNLAVTARERAARHGQLRRYGGAVRRDSPGCGGLSGDVRDWRNSGGASEICGSDGVMRRGSVVCARASRARRGVRRRAGRRARAEARGCGWAGDAERGSTTRCRVAVRGHLAGRRGSLPWSAALCWIAARATARRALPAS